MIGLDLDNTLISYDKAFALAAIRLGLLPSGAQAMTKAEVKQKLCDGPLGETAWMRLQGQVYGAAIDTACLFDGVLDFIDHFHRLGVPMAVVSHKTRFGHFDETRTDLRQAALVWLERHQVLADGRLSAARVFFESTKEDKIRRIRDMDFAVFVDDLPEILSHPDFPATTRRVLFAPAGTVPRDGVNVCRDWRAVTQAVEHALTDRGAR